MTKRAQLNNRAAIIADKTGIDHYVAYEDGLFTLIRGEKEVIWDNSEQIVDIRLYTALTKNELMEAMRLYEEGFKFGQRLAFAE